MLVDCNCGESHRVTIQQHRWNGKLTWSYSFHCSSCGSVIEADGDGFPPLETRLELEVEGIWQVWCLNPENKPRVAQVLRQILNLSLSDVFGRVSDIPGSIFQGTRTEAEWVQHHLQKHGLEAEIRGPGL